MNQYQILQGDNRETLKTLEDNSVDAVVTDPPYGIDFLGKAWDANTGALETYTECLRVLKPGGYILAFSAARTYHHLAVTLEQAGFEIRDQLMWLYASGFPKAQDLGKAIQKRQGVEETNTRIMDASGGYQNNAVGGGLKQNTQVKTEITEVIPTSPEAQQWAGWKTALKPAHEPICMARKPFKGSTIDNVLEHGVGALNIDATRVPFGEDDDPNATFAGGGTNWHDAIDQSDTLARATLEDRKAFSSEQGRFPSNVLGEVEGYQKFFYCPKVSRKERHCGFDDPGALFSGPRIETLANHPTNKMRDAEKSTSNSGNNHPTVKPVELMKYLIKLVTPPNSIVLDPFNGSGSTGMAAVELGHEYIGCELDPAYVDIALQRIRAWNTPEATGTTYEELFE